MEKGRLSSKTGNKISYMPSNGEVLETERNNSMTRIVKANIQWFVCH